MIKATHNRFYDMIFNAYLTRLLKRHFYSFEIFGEIPNFDPKIPILLLPNHSTWWDGFFVYELNKTLIHRPIYMMMLQDQLEKNIFFSKLGAYSIDHRSRFSYKSSLLYTLEILNKNPLVCIFPQGQLSNWNHRPLEFKKGIDFILEKYPDKLNVCLLGMRVELLKEQRPQIFVQFHQNYIHPRDSVSAKKMQYQMEMLLEKLNDNIQNQTTSRIILTGKQNINKT